MTAPRPSPHDDPLVRRQPTVLFTGAEMVAELEQLRAINAQLLAAAQHAAAACPECNGTGRVMIEWGDGSREDLGESCEACAELRAALAAAEG